MASPEVQTLRQAVTWLRAGMAVRFVTVIETWGSAPRPAGSIMAVGEGGVVVGSVSGGCVEEALLERLAQSPSLPALWDFGPARSEERGLPCGGGMRLLVEALEEERALVPALDACERGQPVARQVDLDSGEVRFAAAAGGGVVQMDGGRVERIFGAGWRLLLIGANELARCLAPMAAALGYRVLICDPRPAYRDAVGLEGAQWVAGMPDDAVRTHITESTDAVVTLTHDPRLDDLALMEALASPAFYVGALGSRTTNGRRRQRLAGEGLAPALVARLRGPVGLPLGGRSPAEIAVSIVAEMTAARHGRLSAVQESSAAVPA